MNCSVKSMCLVAVLVIGLLAPSIEGQAYCALRDPNKSIYGLYPQAESFRSLVASIDRDVRAKVGERLPFTLHFNELGKHTLYTTFRDGTPLGFVHVRPEQSKGGLVQVAWALDFELRVVDFSFERCRSAKRGVIEASAFRDQFKGKTFAELRAWLTEDGAEIRSGGLEVPAGAEALALVVLRSGLKTIATTEVGWRPLIPGIQAWAFAARSLPTVAGVAAAKSMYGPSTTARLAELGLADSDVLDRSECGAWVALTPKKEVTGVVVRVVWQPGDQPQEIWWTLSLDGRVVDVSAPGGWYDTEVAAAFHQWEGRTLPSAESCATPLDMAAQEVRVLWEGFDLPR